MMDKSLRNKVAVAGVGHTEFGRLPALDRRAGGIAIVLSQQQLRQTDHGFEVAARGSAAQPSFRFGWIVGDAPAAAV